MTDDQPIRVKKYANRRLYNTASSSYVTLDDLARLVKQKVDFVVTDARSGEDITRSVLTQIIAEAESRGEAMLPLNFLRQLIGLYGNNMQRFVPNYLDQAMRAFTASEQHMQRYIADTMGAFGFPNMEDASQRHLEAFQRAMRMWTPGGPRHGDDAAPPGAGRSSTAAADKTEADKTAADKSPGAATDDARLDELQRQIDRLQSQIRTLTGKPG